MGRWLERAGFRPGTRVHVACVAPGVIELRTADSLLANEPKSASEKTLKHTLNRVESSSVRETSTTRRSRIRQEVCPAFPFSTTKGKNEPRITTIIYWMPSPVRAC